VNSKKEKTKEKNERQKNEQTSGGTFKRSLWVLRIAECGTVRPCEKHKKPKPAQF
jgi:hypothetical protein